MAGWVFADPSPNPSRKGRGEVSATDLPVLLRVPERLHDTPPIRPRAWHGAALAFVVLLSAGIADAQGAVPAHSSVFGALVKWTPLLLRGFGFNILISFAAMVLGTALGMCWDCARFRCSCRCAASPGSSCSSSATRRGWCCYSS